MSCELPVHPYTYTEGDQLPELAGELESTNITGYTITLHLRQPDGTIIIIPAIIMDALNGKFKFAWGATDLVMGLGQEVEVQFVNGGLEQTSPKFLINVVDELA